MVLTTIILYEPTYNLYKLFQEKHYVLDYIQS